MDKTVGSKPPEKKSSGSGMAIFELEISVNTGFHGDFE
jgi:hypothetical protein